MAGSRRGGEARWRGLALTLALLASWGAPHPVAAVAAATPYDIGSPAWTDVWVDPVAGDDGRAGATRATALRTLTAAWNRLPVAEELGAAVRILLVAGTYDVDAGAFPLYWESRWGTREHPILIVAADGRRTARLRGNVNIFDCRYLYLDGLVIDADGGDVVHVEGGHHVLLRDLEIDGAPAARYAVQEALKVNQAQHVYVEASDIHGAWDNALDFVAVQFGHLLANRFHAAGWCVYLKGGSAGFVVERNEIFDCEIGLVAGQGTGFEYMVAPWLHYEAYDLKLINNVIHHTTAIGLGVYGGYNILIAHNTLYRVGLDSHLLEVVYGERSCDGEVARCAAHLGLGGWGTTVIGYDGTQPIPNRNVYVFNNLIVNPPGARSTYQHLTVFGPRSPAPGSNLPEPVRADDGLILRGNWISNGPADHPLGIEDPGDGCQPGHPTCNASQLRSENTINQAAPDLVDPTFGDFRPLPGGNLLAAQTFAIPDFPGGDRVSPPLAPVGDLGNAVPYDFAGQPRGAQSLPGAWAAPGGELDSCAADATTLCLGAGGRFGVRATWRTAAGANGTAQVVALTTDTGLLWFFQASNVELVVKVLDGCAVNGRYWVFAGGLTNVDVELAVTDHASGERRSYRNSLGVPYAPLQDSGAFAGCP